MMLSHSARLKKPGTAGKIHMCHAFNPIVPTCLIASACPPGRVPAHTKRRNTWQDSHVRGRKKGGKRPDVLARFRRFDVSTFGRFDVSKRAAPNPRPSRPKNTTCFVF